MIITFLLFAYFLIGSCIGSFLRCLVERGNTQGTIKDFLFGRSHCDHCKKVLRWYELIPVFSRCIQRGRCNHCNATISSAYLWGEVATGLGFMLLGTQIIDYPIMLQLVFFLLMALLVLIAMIDIKKQELSLIVFGISCSCTLILWYILRTVYFDDFLIRTYSLRFAIMASWYRFQVWLVVRLAGGVVHKIKYGTWGQGFGFGDVLMGGLLGFLYPLLFLLAGSNGRYDAILISMLSTYGILLHISFSSVCGIIGFLAINKDGDGIPFLPYMIIGFACMAIVIHYFSDYIISILAF